MNRAQRRAYKARWAKDARLRLADGEEHTMPCGKAFFVPTDGAGGEAAALESILKHVQACPMCKEKVAAAGT